ncbi:MAG: hypothetical protein NT031_09185 [Planctomycetota bacterium]|nr:hypothetical protein [Planctomycetota bacterium]
MKHGHLRWLTSLAILAAMMGGCWDKGPPDGGTRPAASQPVAAN